MANIQQLSAIVVNKIAAGEVIERPASVVKELVENSVDAAASRIEVTVEKGGLDLIRVTDNGHGIAHDQLELAVTSHATSKISTAEDLFQVSTLGFRGEALASISAVSQMTLRSRTNKQDSGFELRIHGGQQEAPAAPCSSAVGTSIEVANLFYNTPVRRKFLKTTQTEMGHVAEAFARVALARPEIHMTLTHNQRTVHDLPATQNWSERITNFFGGDIGNSLITVSSQDGPIRISGFVVDPAHSRGNNRMQYLFLNGRHIRDRALQHAMGEAYRGLLMTGRFAIAFLRLDMPPELVDVNVHPAKLEVRFQEGSRLYSQLLGALRNKFLSTDLTARAQLGSRRDSEEMAAPSGMPDTRVDTQEELNLASARAHTRDWLSSPAQTTDRRDAWAHLPFDDDTSQRNAERNPAKPAPGAQTIRVEGATPLSRPDWSEHALPGPGARDAAEAAGRALDSTVDISDQPNATDQSVRALQIHNRYLITESEEGLVIIDQHALHERIIYEQLRSRVLNGNLESQQLLVPEPVPLAPAEAAKVIQSADLLKQIGIVVSEFGGDTILVSAYPAMLTNHNPAEMLHSVVDLLFEENKQPEARDIVDELLHMISCKAAVKAGDQLSDEEITALLEHRQLCQDAHHCPHGRPTALVFSREELDRRFKRI